jgi:hypothetical protein
MVHDIEVETARRIFLTGKVPIEGVQDADARSMRAKRLASS